MRNANHITIIWQLIPIVCLAMQQFADLNSAVCRHSSLDQPASSWLHYEYDLIPNYSISCDVPLQTIRQLVCKSRARTHAHTQTRTHTPIHTTRDIKRYPDPVIYKCVLGIKRPERQTYHSSTRTARTIGVLPGKFLYEVIQPHLGIIQEWPAKSSLNLNKYAYVCTPHPTPPEWATPLL
jgi:hypothetical protein